MLSELPGLVAGGEQPESERGPVPVEEVEVSTEYRRCHVDQGDPEPSRRGDLRDGRHHGEEVMMVMMVMTVVCVCVCVCGCHDSLDGYLFEYYYYCHYYYY